jgi:CTP synthase
MESGIQADVLVCRSEHVLPKEVKEKLAKFCNVQNQNVIECIDNETIYNVPLALKAQQFDDVVLEELGLVNNQPHDLEKWISFLDRYKKPKNKIEIALVGKYTSLKDSYKSIVESFIHAGAEVETKVVLRWVYSGDLTKENIDKKLGGVAGVLVAPGFGDRGLDGKILACQYARENKIPFLGICLGMQVAVIEYAKNVLGYTNAESTETNSQTETPVISLMDQQKGVSNKGGTMRLGDWECSIKPDSIAYKVYQTELIKERHRHRYEFNSDYLEEFEKSGFIATGRNPNTNLVEVFEDISHPFYVGVQFHPEYKSTVVKPHPLFVEMINAALIYQKK